MRQVTEGDVPRADLIGRASNAVVTGICNSRHVDFQIMSNKRCAGLISFSAALLLTYGFWFTARGIQYPLLNLAVGLIGIAGMAALWLSNYIRGNELWMVRGLLDYAVFFVGNLAFFLGVLWGRTDSNLEKYLLFAVRLPFFLLLVPIFLVCGGSDQPQDSGS